MQAQHTAQVFGYRPCVPTKRPKTRESIARNLTVLLARKQWTQRDLERESGVSQRSISNILRQAQSPSIEVADALAKPFGLEGWHLILPNLPLDLVHSKSIGNLVAAYAQGNEATRTFLDSIAERELKQPAESGKSL